TDIIEFNKKEVKTVLVIEDNELDSSQIVKMLQDDHIELTISKTGKEALKEISSREYDCIILDYTLEDIAGMDLINRVIEIKKRVTPVIVYSAKDFNRNELNQLNRISGTVILKGVNSLERLLEETVLHLHINHDDLAQEKRKIIENI